MRRELTYTLAWVAVFLGLATVVQSFSDTFASGLLFVAVMILLEMRIRRWVCPEQGRHRAVEETEERLTHKVLTYDLGRLPEEMSDGERRLWRQSTVEGNGGVTSGSYTGISVEFPVKADEAGDPE